MRIGSAADVHCTSCFSSCVSPNLCGHSYSCTHTPHTDAPSTFMRKGTKRNTHLLSYKTSKLQCVWSHRLRWWNGTRFSSLFFRIKKNRWRSFAALKHQTVVIWIKTNFMIRQEEMRNENAENQRGSNGKWSEPHVERRRSCRCHYWFPP